jgi:hypothetical protein
MNTIVARFSLFAVIFALQTFHLANRVFIHNGTHQLQHQKSIKKQLKSYSYTMEQKFTGIELFGAKKNALQR